MDTLINKESTEITEKGLELTSEFCEVEIQRSQLDGKIAKIISGAGGACCQFCTATFKQIHDPDIIKDGFPINRSIIDLKVLFDEINEEEFLSLSSDNRFNVTHRPISDLETLPRVVLRVYNSSRGVDTEELALVSSNIYQSILCAFPWAYVSPTLHKLLAHAPEIISTFNDGHGLENLSEKRLEASNKYIRRYRDRLACKFSFEENLKDVFVRLISHSDLMLLMNRKFSIPRPPSSQGLRSSQDILVNTLIRDHEDHNDD
ncbi:Dna-mediated transposase [Oopsacas minuta]|uniref:Dna-mediated transposase n=1 Tax=Oopsacas minuta TaxID=111878 RepID=A0AAV7JXJ1_9METZ|nr:Dna-mediated transposase [Oopsacas minuta]